MRNLSENMNQAELRDTQSVTPNHIMDVTTHHSTSLRSVTTFPFSFAHLHTSRQKEGQREGREGEREIAKNGLIRVEHSARTMQIALL